MKFTPLKFQASLGAAGMSLMPYNYMKSIYQENFSTFDVYNFSSLALNTYDYVKIVFLMILMFSFVMIHVLLTVYFLKELFVWLAKTREASSLMENPLSNTSIFSPLISLPMTMIVIMGPASFFIPQITYYRQSIMLPGLILFILFWLTLISLELLVVNNLFAKAVDYKKLNFAWLLDVLAFGAVSLFGSSLATTALDANIASIAAIMTTILLLVGAILFISKFTFLVGQQISSRTLPDVKLLPAFFLVIPPNCLLWFSLHKMLVYSNKAFSINTSTFSFIVLVCAYLATISWLVFLAFLLKDYFKSRFIASEFSHAQWGIV